MMFTHLFHNVRFLTSVFKCGVMLNFINYKLFQILNDNQMAIIQYIIAMALQTELQSIQSFASDAKYNICPIPNKIW